MKARDSHGFLHSLTSNHTSSLSEPHLVTAVLFKPRLYLDGEFLDVGYTELGLGVGVGVP